jgi:hypothetical protein
MKGTTTIIYALLLLLAACVPAGQGTLAPKGSGAQEAPAAPPKLGLVTLGEDDDGLQGRLIDPLTLADLPGYESIDFGHHYTSALSPDGRILALITWPSGSPGDSQAGVLSLVELAAWRTHSTEVTFADYVYPLNFGLVGSTFYWVAAARRDPAHGMPRDHALYRYELVSAQSALVTQLPSTFDPWEMHLLSSDDRLAIYGIPTDASNLAENAPRIVLVDLATGAVDEVPLDGVTAGQLHIGTAEDENPYRMYRPGLAWNLQRNLLYVSHADEDRVTVVDLQEGAVLRQVEIRSRQSLLERLLGWGATVAEAKIVPGDEKRAVLSPDGSRLYVVGLRREMLPAGDGDGWTWHETPLGLQVIATEDLTEVQTLNLPVNDLALSPDGRWLLVTGAYDTTASNGEMERVEHGLYVVDGASLKVSAHLLPESEVYLQGFSRDGRHAYISTATREWQGDHYGNWRVTLHLLDLSSGQLVAEREFPGYVLDVIQ